ncbi:TPA: recombinase family protein [Streptococcus suis]
MNTLQQRSSFSVSFISLNENFDTSTPFVKAMIGILSVFAQLEREQITERMQMGKVGKAMNWSRPVFGYEYVNGEYEVNEFEAKIIKRMFEDYMAGISITKLRDKMNEEGHIGKEIPWTYRTIRQTLDNPIHAGFISFKGEIYPGNHEPIISKELYDNVQLELDIRQKQAYEQNNNPRPFQAKYMLSGRIRCGYCGAPLTIQISKLKDGSRRYRYTCKHRNKAKTGPTIYNDGKKCESASYFLKDLEAHTLDQIAKLQLNPKLVEEMREDKNEVDHTEDHQKRIAQLGKKLEKLSNLYMTDMLTIEEVQEKSKPIKKEIKSLEEKLHDAKSSIKENKAVKWINETHVNIKKEPYDKQKEIVNTLVDKVSVTAEQIQISWNF